VTQWRCCRRGRRDARSRGTNAARSVTTNEAGDYSFPSLPPGIYTVKVEKSGSRPSSGMKLNFRFSSPRASTSRMQVGQVSESIEVRASAPCLPLRTQPSAR